MPSWERSGMPNHNYPLANIAEKITLSRQTSLQSQELGAHKRGLNKYVDKYVVKGGDVKRKEKEIVLSSITDGVAVGDKRRIHQ